MAQDEVLDRVRRVEAKLTDYLVQNGYRRSTPPVWEGGRIIATSPAVSLRDCLEVIPAGTTIPVPVWCGDDLLCWVSLEHVR